MAKKSVNYTKLGLFVLAGIAFLVLLLYVIGKNQNMFGKTFALKARFENVYGLVPGNNIRFAGIDAGSVKEIEVINDTTIEVTLLIKTKMKPYIHRNALISIGTDGFIGNKVINIESARTPAEVVQEDDVLGGTRGTDTEQMLKVLSDTNNDIAIIAKELKNTAERINKSKVLWNILNDETLPASIRNSLSQIKNSSDYMSSTMMDISGIVDDVKSGKGTVGKLLRDTAIAVNVLEAVEKIKGIGAVADSLSFQINALVVMISNEVSDGKGTVNALLKDKDLADRLRNTVKNIEQDTQSFNEVIDAIKHSFLFRGYFKKLEKQKKEQELKTTKY
jgi:phospholipid/cholesterol/gamma-HCH transport system substrate-binding protein